MTGHRILAIDVIRGFALMGLFLIHVIEYFEMYWYGNNQAPGPIRDVVTFIFSGKAYSIFALMFGVSFYILLERKGVDSKYSPARFLWRMILLTAIGYLHSLAYPGDILQQLALCGVFLLLVHRLPNWVLYLFVFLFLGQLITITQFYIALQDEAYTQPVFWAWSGRNFEVFAHASLPEFIAHTATLGQLPKWILIFETGSIWHLLGLFVVGLLLGRMGLFENRHKASHLLIALFVALGCALLIWLLRKQFAPYFPQFMPHWCFEVVTGRLSTLSMVAIYVLGILLLVRLPLAARILGVLAPAGRMSLTFYVGQSLVFVPIFYGFGLGLHDTIGQRNALLLGLFAWVVQLVIAHLWFKRFRYGPLEAVWRYLTFKFRRNKATR